MGHTVLREGGRKVSGEYKPRHLCPVYGGKIADDAENGKIIRCDCGRKWHARESYLNSGIVVWARKWL